MEFILVNWLSGVLVRDRFPSLRMGRGNGLYEFQQHGDVWELSFEMCFRQVGAGCKLSLQPAVCCGREARQRREHFLKTGSVLFAVGAVCTHLNSASCLQIFCAC